MLLGFKCNNFRSIRNEQGITMFPGHTRNLEYQLLGGKDAEGKDFEAVKGVLLFGANASGKSNFYKAIRYSSRLIYDNELEEDEIKARKERLFLSPFLMDSKSEKLPTSFEYEIEVNHHLVRYGFEIDSKSRKIVSEWFKEFYVELEDRTIFLRNSDGSCDYGGTIFHVDNEKLFISSFKDGKSLPDGNDSELIRNTWQWFWNSLAVLAPNSSLLWDYNMDKRENWKILADTLSVFDTGIVGMDLFDYNSDDGEPFKEPTKNMRSDNDTNVIKKCDYGFFVMGEDGKTPVKALRFIHGNGDKKVPIHMDQESDGTLRLMRLAPILIRDDKECTYVLDEVDRYLHPSVVYGFIEWFMKKKFKHNKQLIVITHNPHLLDQELIRRDEVWFAQKDKDGKTEFYSLDDYNVRFDRKIERAYYDGYFDGLPRVVLPGDLDAS